AIFKHPFFFHDASDFTNILDYRMYFYEDMNAIGFAGEFESGDRVAENRSFLPLDIVGSRLWFNDIQRLKLVYVLTKLPELRRARPQLIEILSGKRYIVKKKREKEQPK